MKKTIYSVVCSLLVLMSVQQSRAQLIPALGRERAGSAAATFLKIGVGARAAAMGEAFISLSGDASAMYWNPAGMTQLDNLSLYFSHLQYVADIAHQYVGIVKKLTSSDAIGISIITLNTGEMNVTTEVQPFGTGQTFTFNDLMVGISYARQLTDKFSAGITAKIIREDLATVHLTGFLVDVGTIYDTGWMGSRFAVSISNFGAELTASGDIWHFLGNPVPNPEYQTFPAPLMFRIGFSMNVLEREGSHAIVAFQLDHPNDDAEHFNFGAEYWFQRNIALRAGYKRNGPIGGISAGFGLVLPMRVMHLTLDYAFTEFGLLGNLNRFTLNLDF